MKKHILPSALVGLAMLAPSAGHAQRSDRPTAPGQGEFDVTLKPVRDGGAQVVAIQVQSEVRGAAEPQRFSLTTPVTYAGNPGVADRVEGLELRDALGLVPLKVEDDPPAKGGFPYYRHWRAERPVTFPPPISYRAKVAPDGQPPGPPFSIRPTAGGVSGSGAAFLVLPEQLNTAQSKVHWDLSDLASGSFASTTWGEDDFQLKGPPQALTGGWYMAGPGGRFPASGGADHGYSAMWLGTPPYDPAQEMAWAGQAYGWLGKFFGYLSPPPRYRVFIRATPPPNAGGTAAGPSFMTAPRPGDGKGQSQRDIFLHEMIHMWVGGIEGPQGDTSWYGEGLTAFYTRLLMLRAGYEPVEAYVSDVNKLMSDYYASPALTMTPAQITAVGFGDNRIREMPYSRGSFYFADLDAKIRARSRGKRKLDDLLRPMFARREKGEPFTYDGWIAMVTAELGPSAKADFERIILGGGVIEPRPDTFGPCLKREPKTFEANGKSVPGFVWTRVATVSDAKCRAW